MLFHKTLVAFTSVLALTSAAVVKRDAKPTLDKLNTDVAINVWYLNGAISGFDGKPATGIPIVEYSGKLVKALDETTVLVKASTVFTEAETGAVVQTLLPIKDSILAGFDGILAKKDLFIKGGFAPVVKLNLQQLQTSNDAFTAALREKIIDAVKPQFDTLKAELKAKFDLVYAAF